VALSGGGETERRLAVDWPACKAHGVCAELLPEIVRLDEWGYPLIEPGPVPAALRRHAQRAVSSCPTLALRLVSFVEAPAQRDAVTAQAVHGRRARRSP
jgi:ferredoxin